jgi:glucokinase
MVGVKKIGIDLGGTNLRVALIENNKIIKYIKKPTPKNKKKILDEMCMLISLLINKNFKGIGVASPGPLDSKKGIIKNPPNLPFKNFNLKKYLEKKFSVPVKILNDASCVAIAEAELGCKKKNFIIITIGTGIGGGIIINGKLYSGRGFGGELGHIILDNGKYFEKLGAGKKLKELTKKSFGKELNVIDLINKRDIKSKKILNELTEYVGQGIASLINIFDPEIVVLNGGVRESGNKYLNMVRKKANKYVIFPRKTKIIWSKLEHPGVLGASLLIK